MGVRAFVLRQVGSDAHVEQTMGPPLPFPARNILVDVHRVFFKRLPIESDGVEGERLGTVDGEEVVEIWRRGELAERSFRRPAMHGAVRVIYGPGCKASRCEPETVRLVNEWFGYEISIDNRTFHSLQKS
jgi:hypothetical protein